MSAMVVACKVLEEELRILAPQRFELRFLEQGFHRWPQRLRLALQEALAGVSEDGPVRLGYGYCGGALEGLASPPGGLVIPKADDCISLLLGSREARLSWGSDTYFLSAGWLCGEGNLVQEYRRCLARYGREKGRRLMRQGFSRYRRLVFIATGRPGEEAAREAAGEVAQELGLDFEVTGWQDGFLRRLLFGPWDREFLCLEPGTQVSLAGLLAERV